MTNGELAAQQRTVERIRVRWPEFRRARQSHLDAHATGRAPAEKTAENILCDLFTSVLDWTTDQVRLQEERVDIMLTRLGMRYLVVEAKRPGSFDGAGAIARALRQACGYAEQVCVDKVAVSDGGVLEAYDLVPAGLRRRAVVHLADPEPQLDLWWLSTRGIYRVPDAEPVIDVPSDEGSILHPRYQLPARCFAYVGHAERPVTWKLPYLKLDGSVDERRLPKAIQAVLRDYRGEHVRIPEDHVPHVLVHLAVAAVQHRRMPHQDPTPAEVYVALLAALVQLGRVADVPGLPAEVG